MKGNMNDEGPCTRKPLPNYRVVMLAAKKIGYISKEYEWIICLLIRVRFSLWWVELSSPPNRIKSPRPL